MQYSELFSAIIESRSARSAWIEIGQVSNSKADTMSRSARSAWIEIERPRIEIVVTQSRAPLGARGLKFPYALAIENNFTVALRSERVD